MLHSDLTYRIIQCSYALHNAVGTGFRERVYQNGMSVELRHAGLRASEEVPIALIYRGEDIGDFRADFVVEKRVLVELKSGEAIEPAHFAQTLNYLRVSGLEVGLIINFGPAKVQIKRVVRTRDRGMEVEECA